MLEPEKFEMEPPEAMMSDTVKSVEGSEREKERVATSPRERVVMSEVSVIVGGTTVLRLRERELFGSAPSTLKLPDISVNLELATEIRASVAMSAVGVKIAV